VGPPRPWDVALETLRRGVGHAIAGTIYLLYAQHCGLAGMSVKCGRWTVGNVFMMSVMSLPLRAGQTRRR
jgi:hypothetical protein